MRIAFSWGSTGTIYGLGTLYTAVPWALSEAHEPQSHSAFICIVGSLKMVTAVSRFSPTVSMEEPPGPWGESTFHGGGETLVPPPSASVGGTGGVPSPWCPHLSRRWQHWFLPAQLGWVSQRRVLCVLQILGAWMANSFTSLLLGSHLIVNCIMLSELQF